MLSKYPEEAKNQFCFIELLDAEPGEITLVVLNQYEKCGDFKFFGSPYGLLVEDQISYDELYERLLENHLEQTKEASSLFKLKEVF